MFDVCSDLISVLAFSLHLISVHLFLRAGAVIRLVVESSTGSCTRQTVARVWRMSAVNREDVQFMWFHKHAEAKQAGTVWSAMFPIKLILLTSNTN